MAAAALMAVMMVAMAAPAFAHSGGTPGPNVGPGKHDNPVADNQRYGKDAKGGQCITTYKGPSSPPGDAASGGNPGYQFNKDVGAAC